MRHCRAVAEEQEDGDTATQNSLSDYQMTVMKDFSELTWRNAHTNLMVVGNVEEERPGLKLVVHPNAHRRISFTDNSPLVCGWVVRIPAGDTPVSHLWERSAVRYECGGKVYHLYMGGPISYANCEVASAATVRVSYGRTPGGASDSKIYQVKMTQAHGPLEANVEITWEYDRTGPKQFNNLQAPPMWFLKVSKPLLEVDLAIVYP